MYKIYIEEKPLILASKTEAAQFDPKDLRNLLVPYQPIQKNFLYRYIDNLEKKSRNFDSIIIYSEDLEALKEVFWSFYKVIEAAGGLVINPAGHCLAICRNGYWDLPKGKIDKGESTEEAALREVQEETGLSQLSLGRFLGNTYHTYIDQKNRRVLKLTHWYAMETIQENLIPQAEEGIELATWIPMPEFIQKEPIYKNILEVLNLAQQS